MSKPVKYAHDIKSMLLKAEDDGEIILPSEVKLINFSGTVRQFTVLARRLCSVEAINSFSQREQMNIRHLTYIPPSLIAINNNIPFIGLNLKFKPSSMSIKDWVDQDGEKFFDFLIDIIGNSKIKNHKGTRCAFIKNFYTTSTMDYGELLETKILLGTSIFFNDYRVKTNFPNTQEVLLNICHDIYEQILNEFPHLEVELQSYTLEDENMVESSSNTAKIEEEDMAAADNHDPFQFFAPDNDD